MERLPPREFWFLKDVAKAFGITTRAIQYTVKRKGIGKKYKHGHNGIYVIFPKDLDALCEHIHGEVGNPETRKKGELRHANQ